MVPPKASEIARKIKEMEIRGAGKIARSAAEAMKTTATESTARTKEEFLTEMNETAQLLLQTRPTAVSLPNSVRYILHRLKTIDDLKMLKNTAISAAEDFIEHSTEAVQKIGEIGARRVQDGDVLLTHCHSTAALTIIKTAFEQGKHIEVWCTESRPRYQGHIAAKTLAEAGIPTHLIVDSAARYYMTEIDKVIVGADSIAANGALINKIGTSTIALAAHEARVLFFVAAETYKFHPGTAIGELVTIEERDPTEVADPQKFPHTDIRNPAFDVTPAQYIDLIVTERGVLPPEGAFSIIQELYGWTIEEEIEPL